MNVLIVDDSAVVRAMILKTLRMAGVSISAAFEAADGQAGLEALKNNWIDVVFVDINMPVMTGEEMIERVRACPEWALLPIIVVSTEGSRTRIERLQQKGAQFIHKPFSPETVREVVNEMLGKAYEHRT